MNPVNNVDIWVSQKDIYSPSQPSSIFKHLVPCSFVESLSVKLDGGKQVPAPSSQCLEGALSRLGSAMCSIISKHFIASIWMVCLTCSGPEKAGHQQLKRKFLVLLDRILWNLDWRSHLNQGYVKHTFTQHLSIPNQLVAMFPLKKGEEKKNGLRHDREVAKVAILHVYTRRAAS